VLLERRENVRKLMDTKYALYERAVTYEGPEHNSRSAPVRGPILPKRIQSLCTSIVDHVSQVSFNKSKINRMAVNVKIDPEGRVWLMWCSSLRLECRDGNSRDSRCHAPSKQGPVNVEPLCSVPEDVRISLHNTSSTFNNAPPTNAKDRAGEYKKE
jgi:hypothetical protein